MDGAAPLENIRKYPMGPIRGFDPLSIWETVSFFDNILLSLYDAGRR